MQTVTRSQQTRNQQVSTSAYSEADRASAVHVHIILTCPWIQTVNHQVWYWPASISIPMDCCDVNDLHHFYCYANYPKTGKKSIFLLPGSILHAYMRDVTQICVKMYGFRAFMPDARKFACVRQYCAKMASFHANLRDSVNLFIEHSSLGSNETKTSFLKLHLIGYF